jgi:23S rRNA (adenine2503-C2)-methyltransferase
MTNLPKSLIEKLEEEFVVNPLKQRIVQESKDGTIKYLFELPDGMLIETVLMNQHYGLSVCERLKLVVISAVPSAHLD